MPDFLVAVFLLCPTGNHTQNTRVRKLCPPTSNKLITIVFVSAACQRCAKPLNLFLYSFEVASVSECVGRKVIKFA